MGTVETRHNNINQKAQAVMKGIKMKPVTNHKLVKTMMDAHPLAQMFIIEAIARYAEQCAVERLPDDCYICPDAWQAVAINLKTTIDNRK